MTKEEIQDKLELSFGGVYALFYNGECVYVGQSFNVPHRINEHLKEGKKMFNDFRIYYCRNRKTLESDLIRLLKPKYNISEANCDINTERETRSEGEIDKIVDVLKNLPYKIECNADDLSRIFCEYKGDGSPYNRPDYDRILKRYGGYLGRNCQGGLYDLAVVLQNKEQIQQEIVEDAMERHIG